MSDNPGLDVEVLAHERGHGWFAKEIIRKMSIPGLLAQSGKEGDDLKAFFGRQLEIARNELNSVTHEKINLMISQFLPAGFQVLYSNHKSDIKWK